jgi:hypothetical protein
MEHEEKPRLALAFEALDFPFKDKMDICGSKRFPPNLIEVRTMETTYCLWH